MSDSSVIREFLVALGFKVDGSDKFAAGIDKATKIVAELGTTVDAVATAVTIAVTKISNKFEDLYYASQRVRASVANIRAFDYAVSQLGGTAAGARASLEAFGDFLRMNPAGEGILKGLGVQTRDAKGQLLQTTDMLAQFGQRAKAMPYYQARAYASMLGIDSKTLDALMRGTGAYQKHFLDMARQSSVDQDKAAEASARWAQRWRDMIVQVSLFTDKLTLMLQGPVAKVIDWFKAADHASGGLSTTLIALIALAGPLLLVLDPVVVLILALAAGITALAVDYENFKRGAQSGLDWGPWQGEIEAIVGDFKELIPLLQSIAQVIGGFLGPVLGAFVKGELHALHDQLRAIILLMQAVRAFKNGDSKKGFDLLGQAGKAEANALVFDQFATVKAEVKAGVGAAVGVPTKIDGKGLGAAKSVIDFFAGKGWTREQGAGLAANLFTESKLNPYAKGDSGHAFGIGQWHEDRQAAYAKLFGHTMQAVKDPARALQEQLAFVHYELTQGSERAAGKALRGTHGTYEAGASVSLHYERPLHKVQESLKRGLLAGKLLDGSAGGGVTIHQKTDIHVHGSDAHSTAKAVATQQDRVNGNLVRQTKPAAS